MSDQCLSPQEVFQLATSQGKKGKAKAVEGRVPFQDHVKIYDIAIKQGINEEAEYSSSVLLRKNIRRGNTIGVSPSEVFWVRRGLEKFFDIRAEYLQHSGFHDNVRACVLGEAEAALLNENASIEVYKTRKANGENAQISYSRHLNAWVAASKNVCLILRSPEDLQYYIGERYNFARLIAKAWLDYICSLSPQLLESLKHDVSECTLVGEYVGNPNYQHFVRYENTHILFYAMVKHENFDTCEAPLKSFYLFKKYGIPAVSIEKVISTRNIDELFAGLLQVFETISKDTLEGSEEGSVLYFVKNRSDNPDLNIVEENVFGNSELNVPELQVFDLARCQNTLSLGKIKTLEYRIYRKLREKLKHAKKEDNKKLFQRFVKETEDLVKGHELPKPLEEYFEFARNAFKMIKTQNFNLVNNFLDFIDKVRGVEVAKPMMEKAKPKGIVIVIFIPPLYFSQQELDTISRNAKCPIKYQWNEKMECQNNTIYIVQMNVKVSNAFKKNAKFIFLGYDEQGMQISLERLKAIKKQKKQSLPPDVFSFVSSKDVESKLRNLFNSIEQTQEFIYTYYPEFIFSVGNMPCQELGLFISQHMEVVLENPKITYVLLPMGIPCIGKSTLIESSASLINSEWSHVVISSDGLRLQAMEEYMTRHKVKDRSVAFEKTKKKGPELYFNNLKKSLSSDKDVHIVLSDKNNKINAMNSTIDVIRKGKPSDRQIKLILLAPQTEAFIMSNGTYFPLSLSLLFQCLLRVKQRKSHATLEGSLPKRISIVFMMYNFFRNCKMEAVTKNFDHVIRIPFTDENIVPDEYFQELVENTLERLKPGEIPFEDDLIELAEYISRIEISPQLYDWPSIFLGQLNNIIDGSPITEIPNTSLQPIRINLEESLGGYLVSLLQETIGELGLTNAVVEEDMVDIQQLEQFKRNASISKTWKFPDSLSILSEELTVEDQEVSVSLQDIVYIPSTAVFARCSLPEFTTRVPCFLPLLVSNAEASLEELAKREGSYSYRLDPEITLQGVTKRFR